MADDTDGTEEDVQPPATYSIRNVLTQKPDDVKAAVLAVATFLVVAGIIKADGAVIAAGAFAFERTLSLLYAKPLANRLAQQSNDEHALKGIALGQALARTRPLRSGGPADPTA